MRIVKKLYPHPWDWVSSWMDKPIGPCNFFEVQIERYSRLSLWCLECKLYWLAYVYRMGRRNRILWLLEQIFLIESLGIQVFHEHEFYSRAWGVKTRCNDAIGDRRSERSYFCFTFLLLLTKWIDNPTILGNTPYTTKKAIYPTKRGNRVSCRQWR